MAAVAPYGSWRSPITVDLLVGATVGLGSPGASEHGIYWLESRPHEAGRTVLVFRPNGGEPVDVVPADFNVRSRVHEYGGGAYWRHGPVVFASSFADCRVYRFDAAGAEPQPVTPEPPEPSSHRYADGAVTPDGRTVVCVRERHEGGEVLNELVAFPADGSAEPSVIASGHDFYASPRLDPAGRHLAWICWDHPRMPFDGTELYVAAFAADAPGEPRLVAGGPTESVLDPQWSPDGVLHFVSDRTGWWNLYNIRGDHMRPLATAEGEFAAPWWVFGRERYAFLEDGRIACVVTRAARDSLELLDPATGRLEPVDAGYTSYTGGPRAAGGNRLLAVASSPTTGSALVAIDVARVEPEVVARSSPVQVDDRYVSTARPIEFPNGRGETVHAFFYPPRNPDFEPPAGELPPLVVEVHGGPTDHSTDALSLRTQYYTSRGIAVVDVNYGGSTGYGRAYRDRLVGQWGVVDVDDCVAAASYLAEQGEADPDRILITGGSAGGYTTLLALAIRDEFSAGISVFGVADLELLYQDSHKFESHYEISLIGPYPESRELWRERSPLEHSDGISAPLLLHQGSEDKVVPPAQAEAIVAVLERRGVPHAYLEYEGEGHGFRRADSQRRMLEANLAFMGQVFGFAPADELQPLEIRNLEHVAH